MRKVTVSRMRDRYAQTVLTFRIIYIHTHTHTHVYLNSYKNFHPFISWSFFHTSFYRNGDRVDLIIYVYVWVLYYVCVGVLVICVLVFTVFCMACTVFFVMLCLCVFVLICFVCTSVRTTATERPLNCS